MGFIIFTPIKEPRIEINLIEEPFCLLVEAVRLLYCVYQDILLLFFEFLDGQLFYQALAGLDKLFDPFSQFHRTRDGTQNDEVEGLDTSHSRIVALYGVPELLVRPQLVEEGLRQNIREDSNQNSVLEGVSLPLEIHPDRRIRLFRVILFLV